MPPVQHGGAAGQPGKRAGRGTAAALSHFLHCRKRAHPRQAGSKPSRASGTRPALHPDPPPSRPGARPHGGAGSVLPIPTGVWAKPPFWVPTELAFSQGRVVSPVPPLVDVALGCPLLPTLGLGAPCGCPGPSPRGSGAAGTRSPKAKRRGLRRIRRHPQGLVTGPRPPPLSEGARPLAAAAVGAAIWHGRVRGRGRGPACSGARRSSRAGGDSAGLLCNHRSRTARWFGAESCFYVTLAGRQGRWRLARCSWPRPAPRTPPSLIRAAEPRLRATERSVSPASLRHRPRWHLPGKSVCRAPGRGCSSSSSTQSGTGGGGRGLGGPGGSPARGAVSGVEWNEALSVRGGSGGALAGSVLLCCTVHVSVTNLLVRPEL